MTSLIRGLIVGGSMALAYDLSYNFPTCARLLGSLPETAPSPAERASLISDLNAARAALEREYSERPPNLRPPPPIPSVLLADGEEWRDLSRAWKAVRRDTRSRNPVEVKFHAIADRIDYYATLAERIGHARENIFGVQLVGTADIRAYLDDLASDPDPVFATVFRRHHLFAEPSAAARVERAWFALRRVYHQARQITDRTGEILHPVNEGAVIRRRVNRFWTKHARLSTALYSDHLFDIHPDFVRAFSPAPDVRDLGWGGRDDPAAFLALRREQIVDEQVRFALNPLRGIETGNSLMNARLAEMGHPGWSIEVEFVPGWRVESGTTEPLLTVVVGIEIKDGGGGRPRRRAAAAAATPAFDAPGDMAPAH